MLSQLRPPQPQATARGPHTVELIDFPAVLEAGSNASRCGPALQMAEMEALSVPVPSLSLSLGGHWSCEIRIGSDTPRTPFNHNSL